MSAALRMREHLAMARLGNALGVSLDPDKVNAVLLEELADAAEYLLGIDAPSSDPPRSPLVGE